MTNLIHEPPDSDSPASSSHPPVSSEASGLSSSQQSRRIAVNREIARAKLSASAGRSARSLSSSCNSSDVCSSSSPHHLPRHAADHPPDTTQPTLPSAPDSCRRCCKCCQTGRCVRCSCVTAGRPCVDCYPSRSGSCSNHAATATSQRPTRSSVAGLSQSFPAACSPSCNASPTDIDISQASPPSPAQDVLQELDTGSTRSECPNCHGFFQVTSSGLLRAHGPAHNRCPGSSTSVPTAEPNLPHSAPVLSAPDPPLPTNTIPLVSPAESFKEHQPQVIRRIPKGSRDSASQKLCEILGDVLSNNSIEAWMHLLMFLSRCLRVPTRSGRRWSLSSSVNKQIADEASLSPTCRPHRSARQSSQSNSPEVLSRKISQKLEEGDFSGAVRLACSEDSLAPVNDTTFSALLAKHPPPSESSILPPPPPDPASIQISFPPDMVAQAICSFSPGSAGGKDGLSPQHLKDMLNPPSGVTAPLLSALSSFSFHVFSGKTPPLIRPIFWGQIDCYRKKGWRGSSYSCWKHFETPSCQDDIWFGS